MKKKQCITCKEIKPISHFYQHKTGINKGYYFSYCNPCARKHGRERKRKRFKLFPWIKTLAGIKSRVYCKKHGGYYLYKNRELSLTSDDLKHFWFRDKAYLMKYPSIHRIDNDKGYTFENCQYIEKSKNSSLGTLVRKNKENYGIWRPQKKKRYCKRGHKYTLKNTYICKNERRHCRKCMKIRRKRYEK